MLRALGLVALSLSVAACDSGGEPGPSAPPPPAEDEVVAGVNLTRLFARPTAAERDSVALIRQTRAADRDERYAYTEVGSGEDADGASLVVFEGRLVQEAGSPVAHHALLRLPPRTPGEVRSLPLTVVSPRFPDASVADLLIGETELVLSEDAAQLLLTLRGGTLRALGRTFRSDASGLPYDADAEDALAALGALLAPGTLPVEVDASRLAWVGFGRGGTVALLGAAQEGQVDAVVSWAAPTSFFLPNVSDEVERALRGGDPSDLPAFDPLYRELIFPIRGDSAALAQAREGLLLRSPLYVAGSLPPTLLVHSPQDRTVDFGHAQELSRLLDPPPPFNLALFSFSNEQITPGHDGTFESFVARRTNAQFLAYHLDL